ncbi:baseplate J/gp47 family protein [Lactobacillus gallinarum]|uniref:baseplate J/gp47 family protein n=1 Tax=Lactobacillus gallinarum TaxID=52242 RepID=UPI000B36D81C|nr:baseplate J/gp47 family protein [Lactobacillus gallinarum]OUQ01962.1 hypothetical protein B5E95_00225 [Lactobacillus gallinarum]
MNPEQLAEEYEQRGYEFWLDEMLTKVPENIDKREGSVIYDGLAPAAMLMALQSQNMATIIRETYIKTASGEFLDYRAVEHGTQRYAATNTVVKAKFEDYEHKPLNNVVVGDRFASIGEIPIFYTVTKINDDLTGELTAETPGSGANGYIGQILPVTPNDRVNWAEILEVTIPARDEETDEHLRKRLLNTNSWVAYGGNVADYLDMISKINDVGAAQVYPTWAGPGTVKLVIVGNDYRPASAELVHKVKEQIDPEDKTTEGLGLAPIDHRVTVVAPEALTINVKSDIQLLSESSKATVESNVKQALEDYFKELRQKWSEINQATGRGYSLVVYRSQILSKIMTVEGIANASLPLLNDKDSDVILTFNNNVSQIPFLGEVVLNG